MAQPHLQSVATGQSRGGEADPIRTRGTRDGLVVAIPADAATTPPAAVAAALIRHFAAMPDFFAGAEVIVDLGERDVADEELLLYRQTVEAQGIVLRGFTAATPHVRALIRQSGQHPLQMVPADHQGSTRRASAPAELRPDAQPQSADAHDALYIRRTLRSGTQVRHHGHVVILGDVNAGADVAASGDIIVWGVVRGTVHAGALGDDRAIICALGLSPTQLRIGSHYALPPAEKRRETREARTPERVRLENGRLIVEPWKEK